MPDRATQVIYDMRRFEPDSDGEWVERAVVEIDDANPYRRTQLQGTKWRRHPGANNHPAPATGKSA